MIRTACLMGTIFLFVFAGAGVAPSADVTYKGRPDIGWRTVKLSEKGSDRATAYSMSNKIVQTGERLFVVWLDVVNQTHWTLVDVGRGEIVNEETIGGTLDDNHCGPAAWMDSGGDIFVLTGAHWRKLPLHLYKARVNGNLPCSFLPYCVAWRRGDGQGASRPPGLGCVASQALVQYNSSAASTRQKPRKP